QRLTCRSSVIAHRVRAFMRGTSRFSWPSSIAWAGIHAFLPFIVCSIKTSCEDPRSLTPLSGSSFWRILVWRDFGLGLFHILTFRRDVCGQSRQFSPNIASCLSLLTFRTHLLSSDGVCPWWAPSRLRHMPQGKES